ncbi:hypothetical protein N8Q82_14135 [Enterobacter roggenkampii]|uniref:hypothetical protein n=1 Tax=Enterobacter roggenkampii TaxID=1812935 RepID=UPI0021C7F3CC|nr:hypothetical protein [Enterobacter roggenkampii]MCU2347129.1 hypothetical protein [Enterobacter roggenkampii]
MFIGYVYPLFIVGSRLHHLNEMSCEAFKFALCAIAVFRSVAAVHNFMRFSAKNFAALHSKTCYINYGVSFPMFEKVEVNGAAAHPIFRFLKDELPGVLGGRIKWNFTKFLVGRDGKPLKRFAPMTTPEKMEGAIVAALGR